MEKERESLSEEISVLKVKFDEERKALLEGFKHEKETMKSEFEKAIFESGSKLEEQFQSQILMLEDKSEGKEKQLIEEIQKLTGEKQKVLKELKDVQGQKIENDTNLKATISEMKEELE